MQDIKDAIATMPRILREIDLTAGPTTTRLFPSCPHCHDADQTIDRLAEDDDADIDDMPLNHFPFIEASCVFDPARMIETKILVDDTANTWACGWCDSKIKTKANIRVANRSAVLELVERLAVDQQIQRRVTARVDPNAPPLKSGFTRHGSAPKQRGLTLRCADCGSSDFRYACYAHLRPATMSLRHVDDAFNGRRACDACHSSASIATTLSAHQQMQLEAQRADIAEAAQQRFDEIIAWCHAHGASFGIQPDDIKHYERNFQL